MRHQSQWPSNRPSQETDGALLHMEQALKGKDLHLDVGGVIEFIA